MQAGKLDRRISLRHRVLTRNANGENVASYTEYASVWGGKRDLRGREFFAAQQINAELQATWRIRWRSDVTVTDRLVDDAGVVFDVIHIAEIGRREGLDLYCRAVPA
jgi:SPP1 family predicted phage head-tail adaptor